MNGNTQWGIKIVSGKFSNSVSEVCMDALHVLASSLVWKASFFVVPTSKQINAP